MTRETRMNKPCEPEFYKYTVVWLTRSGQYNQLTFDYKFEAMNKVDELWNGPDDLVLLHTEALAVYIDA